MQNGTLFDRRLIFVVGKGGVGRTTASIAFALAAARLKKTTLLVEVGEANSIGPLFEQAALTPTPEPLRPGIFGARIEAKTVLDAYVHAYIGSGFIADRLTHSQLFDHIVAATPGLKEVMTLGQIWRWEQETSDRGVSRFDLVIVDAPATGHGLSWLRVPQVLVDMIRVGPIAEQIQWLEDLLHDRQKTSLTLVTLPEELPVNEAIEFEATARDVLNMPVDVTLVNGIYPKIFTPREAAQIERQLKAYSLEMNDGGDFTRPLLESARAEIIRRKLQEAQISRLRESLASRLLEIPFYFTNELTLDETQNIAELLLRELSS
jgi:anion-transporting  ArsA/GET3 family ATPase